MAAPHAASSVVAGLAAVGTASAFRIQTPLTSKAIAHRWFSSPNACLPSAVPLLKLIFVSAVWRRPRHGT